MKSGYYGSDNGIGMSRDEVVANLGTSKFRISKRN